MITTSDGAAVRDLYTVHCASYKAEQQAANDVKYLSSQGYSAFFMQVEIKGKGKWYRVMSGKYETKEKARIAADGMVKKNVLSKYFILPLPDQQINTVEMGNVKQVKDRKDKNKNRKQEAKKQTEISAKNKSLPTNPVTSSEEKQPFSSQTKAIEKTVQTLSPAILGNSSATAKNQEARPVEKEDKNSGSTVYDRALDEMKEKKYLQALETFKEFVARGDTSKILGEKALRHMADCHFFLGESGDKNHLKIAAEFYKNTLQSFPDDQRENALVYFRLAKTNEYLNNYSDALKNYETMLVKYPHSPYVPEASFKVGQLLHKSGKYGQAVDRLIAYLLKNKGGDFAREAFYLTADCYNKLQQSATAEIWYRDAQKKWPDFLEIPKELALDMGQHKLSMRRYDEAINLFSLYASVYAGDEKTKEAMFLLGDSYKAADQVSAALNTYNLIIDKYPESREAAKSVMAMASLGVDKPGIKLFSALKNVQYYTAPIEAYDSLIAGNLPVEIKQTALLQKGNALHKLKQDRKATDIYLEFLKTYPQSRMVAEARKGLKQAAGSLIEGSYRQKDYLAVADFYFKAYRNIQLQPDDYDAVNQIAMSLSKLNLSDDCIALLKNYKRVCRDEKISGALTVAIAEEEIARKKYDEAEKILGELLAQTPAKNTSLIVSIKKNMAEIAYQRKMYDKAAVDFDAVINSGHDIYNAGQTYWRYASSLKEKKDDALALKNYLLAFKYLNQNKERSGEAYKEAGDLYFKAGNYKDSLYMYNKAVAQSSDNIDLKNWSLFYAGKSHWKMSSDNEAQKIFTRIKTESGVEGFWTKVVDYYVQDQSWWDKYREYLKN